MKAILRASAILALSFVLGSQLRAKDVAVFVNGSYVDDDREALYLTQSLRALGHNVWTFTGIAASDWTNALAGADVLVIPELEIADLYAALSVAARSAIQSFVSGGGGIILTGDALDRGQALMNGLFGWSVDVSADNLTVATSLHAGPATGTVFAWGPATLPYLSAVWAPVTSTLPSGALNLYSAVSGVEKSSVFAKSYGAGKVVHLAFDWYTATGKESWENVLDRAVDYAARPSPKTVALFFSGAYTDTAREAVYLSNSLSALGHTVQTFTGITAPAWTAALTGVDLLVIPELEYGNLYAALAPDARAVIQNYMNSGGRMLMAGDGCNDYGQAFMNGIFGWSVDVQCLLGVSSSLNTGAAARTPFAVGPPSLPKLSAVDDVLTSTLPVGALNLYSAGSPERTTAFAKLLGPGKFVYLGFDWYSTDAGKVNWENVLSRAVQYLTTPDPRTPTAAFRDNYSSIGLSLQGSATLYNAGGASASNPATAQNLSGDTFVAVRDSYNSVWARVFLNRTKTWRPWAFGAGVTKGTPAIAVTPDGTAYISARDNWNSVWLIRYAEVGGFGSWIHLGGVLASDPVLTACPDGSLYVIGKDGWNSMWSGRYVPGSGFQGWEWGGGVIQGNPAATCGSDNAVYVSVRDNWNSVWMGRVKGSAWTAWHWGGGVVSADPQVASGGNGLIYVVARDAYGGMWRQNYREGTASGWPGWVYIGGALLDYSPAATDGQLYFAGRSSANDLWWYRTVGSSWQWLFGQTSGPLRAAPR